MYPPPKHRPTCPLNVVYPNIILAISTHQTYNKLRYAVTKNNDTPKTVRRVLNINCMNLLKYSSSSKH